MTARNEEKTPWTYEDYTVAFVCAMSFEMSAIHYMLDREHPSLDPKQNDSNAYILGELSGHNVVLVCLPGNQGKGSAATVATNLSRTFPSIKWQFLVGIGGGVPSPRHDIRLGDVVISMPDGQYGGVVQYDLGKDTEAGFNLKGFLWPLPSRLRSAVEKMRSDHLDAPNKVSTFISAILRRSPGLSSYERPPDQLDTLFEADYPHVPHEYVCQEYDAEEADECARCDPERAVKRPLRESPVPKIHYGLIASGDQVMRNAKRRDSISRDLGGVLCFEMEAAGLMTEFSCIVIRGISDYADSHKSDRWHRYAAAAAAGCAKELLGYLGQERPVS